MIRQLNAIFCHHINKMLIHLLLFILKGFKISVVPLNLFQNYLKFNHTVIL